MSRVAIYARVSTKKDQTVDNQLLALRDWAEARSYEVVAEFTDEGISGRKGRDQRPGLDAMLSAVVRGKINMVAVTALDRLGRSLPHLITTVAELEALKVGLFVHNLALDTTTPAGQLMFNIMGSLAQFERELIRERTMLGMERARRQGKRIGRPKISPQVERRIAEMLNAGVSINRAARIARVSVSTAHRIKRESICPQIEAP